MRQNNYSYQTVIRQSRTNRNKTELGRYHTEISQKSVRNQTEIKQESDEKRRNRTETIKQ